jgi:hypothetical protein
MDTRKRNTIFCIVAVMLSVFWFQNAFGYQINLNKGLNLISLPEQPANTAIHQVTSSIAGKFNSIWAYVGGSWKLYNPGNSNFSDLLTMEAGRGYWIDMKESGALLGSGTAAPSSIPLSKGWNLIGYNSTIPASVTDALKSISGKYNSVWTHTNGAWKLYDPKDPNFSDLTSMEPGVGYWIDALESCSLDFSGLSGTTISPDTGGTVTTGDGASVSFPPQFGRADVTLKFTKVSDASGEVVDDMKTISGEYNLKIVGAESVESNFYVSIPVVESLLPQDVDSQKFKACLRPEFYDNENKIWKPLGSMIKYDDTTPKVSFDVSLHQIISESTSSMAKNNNNANVPLWEPGFSGIPLRIRYVMSWLRDNPDCSSPPYYIYYIGPDPKNEHSIPDNTKWWLHRGGFFCPNYTSDMLWAFITYGAALADIKDSVGKYVFGDAPAKDIYAYVCNIGEAGMSPIGGPVLISSKLENWPDMRGTVAHELVHFFQGQKYSTWTYSNKWFSEATAQYYSAKVASENDEEKKLIYGGNGGSYFTDYLSVPIYTDGETSMYALGHFLECLENKSGAPLVADVLNNRSSSDDLENLEAVLKKYYGSIGEALDAYLRDLLRDPESMSGINKLIKEKMDIHAATNYLYTSTGTKDSSTLFTDELTYKVLVKILNPLTGVYISFGPHPKLTRDALLVLEVVTLVGSDQSSYLFAFKGDNKTKSSYENNDPVDRGMVFPYPKPITIKNFNGTGEDSKKLVEHLIFNKSKKEDRAVGVTYYILERPKITQVGQGTTGGIIVWETKGIGTKGGIPVDYIKGYDVYDKSGKKLNNVMIGLPATAGSDQSFESPEIDPTKTGPNDYTVVIVDKYGNSWPEVQTTPTPCELNVQLAHPSLTIPPGGTVNFRTFVTTFNCPYPVTYSWDFTCYGLTTHSTDPNPSFTGYCTKDYLSCQFMVLGKVSSGNTTKQFGREGNVVPNFDAIVPGIGAEAIASATPMVGNSPLTVTFSGPPVPTDKYDPCSCPYGRSKWEIQGFNAVYDTTEVTKTFTKPGEYHWQYLSCLAVEGSGLCRIMLDFSGSIVVLPSSGGS